MITLILLHVLSLKLLNSVIAIPLPSFALFTGSKQLKASNTSSCHLLTKSSYMHNLISVQPPRSTRSSSLVTLTQPSTSSSLRITDHSFRYASPCLWNQLPSSLRQPHSSLSVSDLPVPAPITSSHSVNSPFSPSITSSLSLPTQSLPISQIFPTIGSLPTSGLTPRPLRLNCFS